jgi:Mce-associated membrane protein
VSAADPGRVPTANWYDVLDVDQHASTDEIRDAWRAAIADLTPADRRFRLYNQAGEVLLDPERRAAHDADLAAEEPEVEKADEPVPTTAPAPPAAPVEPPADAPAGAPSGSGGRRFPVVPTWSLAVAGVLAALVAGLTVYLLNQPSEEDVTASVASARGAAERAVVPLLSYDYRDLDGTEQAAHDVMTSDYRERYDQLFAVIEENAPSTRTVVQAEMVAAAVVRADDAGDRVEILVFVDQARTNRAGGEPEVFRNQARLTMQRVDGEWLVDDVVTSPAGP